MIKLTGVDREVIEKWLYVIVGTALFTGILGTGHHYYWIGTPGYWQWIGSIFSRLESLPFFAMVLFTFTMVWKGRRDHPNKAALLWSLGCAVLAFFGAGVLGLPAHAARRELLHPRHAGDGGAWPSRLLRRLCLLNLAMMTYAFPQLLSRAPYNQVLNMVSFWILSSGVVFMTAALTFAGVLQTHLERVMGMSYMDVAGAARPVLHRCGLARACVTALGVVLFICDPRARSRRRSRAASLAR